LKIIFVLVVLCLLTCPQNGYAYLDAGTGSYIIQMIIAASVTGLYLVKLFWKKIINFFKSIFSKETKA